MEYRVGIDLGGTNVAVGVVDENKQIIARASIKTRPERMLDDVIYDIGCCVKEAVKKKSENVIFAGYVEAEELRNAYCGADAFAFFSYEETEGIVVLEALACEVPVVLRDIPVYKGWIQDQIQAYKVHNLEEYKHNLMHIFKEKQEELKGNARELAERRSIRSAGERLKVVYRLSGVNVLQSTHRGLPHRSVWKQEI